MSARSILFRAILRKLLRVFPPTSLLEVIPLVFGCCEGLRKGSIEIDIVLVAIRHINRFIRKTVWNETTILTVDGQESRNRIGGFKHERRKTLKQ